MKKTIYIVILLIPVQAFMHHTSMATKKRNINEKTPASTKSTTTVTLQTGFLYGTIGEYVYSRGQKISELTWDIKPLIYIGNIFKINLENGISAGFDYKLKLNRIMGEIQDTDWDSNGNKTRLSVHDCALIRARIFNVFVGYVFRDGPLHKILPGHGHELKPRLGYKYQNFLLEARDGYSQTPPWEELNNENGTFIQYEQDQHIPYISIAWRYPIYPDFLATIEAAYSPAVFCNALDFHISRNTEFHDQIKWAKYYAIEASLKYISDARTIFSTRAAYIIIPETKGDTYTRNRNTGERSRLYEGGAGFSYNAWEWSLLASLVIKWRDGDSR